jgi:MFS family permease
VIDEVSAVQRRTVMVLSGAQVLGGLGVGAGVAASGLIAVQVSGTESVAGLASTTTVLGAALAAVPLASLTRSRGRRTGLSAGMLTGCLGAVLVVTGVRLGLLPLVLVGTLVAGAANASGLQARYAATDLATPEHAAGALSLVVWAATIGSVLGPNLIGIGSRIGQTVGVPGLGGCYVISAITFACAALVLWTRLRPDPLLLARATRGEPSPARAAGGGAKEAWKVIGADRNARLGLVAVALGHATMISVMVMTPVHMAHADVSVTIIGLVISVHILGMFAFSPLVGAASDRFGRHSVLLTGAGLLLAAAVVVGLAEPHTSTAMGSGLFLLGLGWSCTLIAGSALLSESVPAVVRQEVQGVSDMTMNLCGALAGALAGGVVAVLSYGWLALFAGAAVLPLTVFAWPRSTPRNRAPSAPAD